MNKYSGLLTINLGEIRQNYALFQQKVGASCTVASVVKADSYGVGMKQAAVALHAAGCRMFFVATPEEGAALRGVLDDAKIAVLNGFYQGDEHLYRDHKLTPVLNSLGEIEAYSDLVAQGGQDRNCILHFNTGMNRLGMGNDETTRLLSDGDALGELKVETVMSHFACADEPGNPMNDEQCQKFQAIAARFKTSQKSMANSFGVFRSDDYHFDMVRPGMGLYGLNPEPKKDNPMNPVVHLEVSILQIHQARKDESVGYGATYKLDKDARLATVAMGYADGFLRALGNAGALYWKGLALPVVGRVSMDLVSVDLSAVQEGDMPEVGDMLEVIGTHQSADDLAAAAGTIGYEILTGLGQRYERAYINPQEPD